MAKQKYYFPKKKFMNPAVRNRRDADKLIDASYKVFLLLGLMSLRDEFGFGTKRMEKFMDKMSDLLDSYNKGYLNAKDLSNTIKEETGIDVPV